MSPTESARLTMDIEVCAQDRLTLLSQPGGFSLSIEDDSLVLRIFCESQQTLVSPRELVIDEEGGRIRVSFLFSNNNLSITVNGEKRFEMSRANLPVFSNCCSSLAIGTFEGMVHSLTFWREQDIVLRVLTQEGEVLVQNRVVEESQVKKLFYNIFFVSILVIIFAYFIYRLWKFLDISYSQKVVNNGLLETMDRISDKLFLLQRTFQKEGIETHIIEKIRETKDAISKVNLRIAD